MDVGDGGEQHPCMQSCRDASDWGGHLKDTPVAAQRLQIVIKENCVPICCHRDGQCGDGEGPTRIACDRMRSAGYIAVTLQDAG